MNQCLRVKEEELNYLKACLEQKEKELEIYVDKNKKTKIIISNRKANNIKTNDRKEKELYEQISIYEKEIECKNKEITILRKRILTLVIYLKRKDKNILILDNELKIFKKENEEMRIDNDVLTIENKKLEKIKDNLINKKKCTCNLGLERYNTVLEQQKTDAEKLRNRFNGLFKELSEYRKKNIELNKELKKLQEGSAVSYKQNNIADSSLTTVDKARKTLEEHIPYSLEFSGHFLKKINMSNLF